MGPLIISANAIIWITFWTKFSLTDMPYPSVATFVFVMNTGLFYQSSHSLRLYKLLHINSWVILPSRFFFASNRASFVIVRFRCQSRTLSENTKLKSAVSLNLIPSWVSIRGSLNRVMRLSVLLVCLSSQVPPLAFGSRIRGAKYEAHLPYSKVYQCCTVNHAESFLSNLDDRLPWLLFLLFAVVSY